MRSLCLPIFIIFNIYVILHVFVSSAFFNTSEKSYSNTLQTGEWIPATTSVVLVQSGLEYSSTESVTSFVDESGEHFQIQINPENNQYLSFSYKLTSQETAELFDTPAVVVFIGTTPVLQISRTTGRDNSQWQKAYIDVSQMSLEAGIYDLVFQTQNTFDSLYTPQFEVKEVTTTKLFVKGGDILQFQTNKPVESIVMNHTIWENSQEIPVQMVLEPASNTNQKEWNFTIPDTLAGTDLLFGSVDLFGNTEEQQVLFFDQSLDSGISDIQSEIFIETENQLTLQLNYQNNGEFPYYFQVRSSVVPITTQSEWSAATVLPELQHHMHIKATVPAHYTTGIVQRNLVLQNVPGGLQYISVRTCTVATICTELISNQLLEYPL